MAAARSRWSYSPTEARAATRRRPVVLDCPLAGTVCAACRSVAPQQAPSIRAVTKPLVVIPSYLSRAPDVEVLGECVASIRRTAAGAVDVLVVDDHSAAPGLVDVFQRRCARYDVELLRQPVNEGFSRTVNVGLQRALSEGREVILVNADIVVLTGGWLDAFRAAGAGVVGAVLLSARGLIAHAGFYLSRVTGTFEHRFAGAPADLPEALEVAPCPVSGAFQYIRPEVLEAVGIFDPEFRMGSEDVDFCLRAAQAGFASVCQGRVRALHGEAVFRGRPSPRLDRWHAESYAHFQAKWPPARLAGRVADLPTPGEPPAPANDSRALFVGQAGPGSLYHRVVLPATALGSDWCVANDGRVGRGIVGGSPGEPSLDDYETVVIQMPAQPEWLDIVKRLQRRGARVLYELDWHLHAHVEDAPTLRLIEALMRACDGVVCATAFLAERCAPFNAHVYVCENGLDLRAYAVTRPPRETVTIGWAGTTMVVEDIADSVAAIAGLMRERPNVNLVSLGQPVAELAAGHVDPRRCAALGMVLVEQYPAALTMFDVVFEPPRVSPRRRGRSQLRWLETGALGTPLVADAETFPGIEDGVTGLHARDAGELAEQLRRLVDDAALRARVGEAARRKIVAEHSMPAAATSWAHALGRETPVA